MIVVVCCCLCCLFLRCLFNCLCLCCFAFSCFQLCRMFLYRLITNTTNITNHTTNIHVCVCNNVLLFVFVFVCVACRCFCVCSVLFFLFPTIPHVPLYVNNEHNKHHKTQNKKHVCGWWCLLLCVMFVVCVVCSCVCGCVVLFSCFQLCRMFLYRLVTNMTNITKHKTNTHVCVCCCLLLFVLFVFRVVCSLFCVCYVLLVSNYAACSLIG